MTDDEREDYLAALQEEYDRFKSLGHQKERQKHILHMMILEVNRKGVSKAAIARRFKVSRPYVTDMCQQALREEKGQT